MSKQKKKRRAPSIYDYKPAERDPRGRQKVKGRYLLGVLAAVVAAYALYLVCFNFGIFYIIHIYGAVLFVSLLAFGILNRGFSQRLPTAEDIPDPAELEKELVRRKRGRYFLVPVIAVVMTFMLDLVWLQFLQPLFGG